MTLAPAPDRWDIKQVTADRVDAVAARGFTERQARFLATVMLHAGVFVERQYCSRCGETGPASRPVIPIRSPRDSRLSYA